MWAEVSGLTFRQDLTSNRVDIAIKFVVGNHGDGSSFDQAGGVLAHAFYPRSGMAHFDDMEKWSLTGGGYGQ